MFYLLDWCPNSRYWHEVDSTPAKSIRSASRILMDRNPNVPGIFMVVPEDEYERAMLRNPAEIHV